MISEYLRTLESSLATRSWITGVEVKRCDILETPNATILVYRFRVSLVDGGLLEMMERVVGGRNPVSMNSTTYCFHWQDSGGQLKRRWDNAPHFPRLPGFPHHIHASQHPEDVVSGAPIDGLQVLAYLDPFFATSP